MSTRTIDSTDTKSYLDRSDESRATDQAFGGPPPHSEGERKSFSTLASAQPIDDGPDYVEGLPLALVETYADIATRHALVKEIDSGHWFASIVGLEGVWGDGDSPDEALVDLRESVVDWIAVKRRVGATDIPTMEGIDLNPPE